jgi:hypothetical protein
VLQKNLDAANIKKSRIERKDFKNSSIEFSQKIRCEIYLHMLTRVARWHIFKPKIAIWVNLGGSFNGRCWYFYDIWSNYMYGPLV